MNILNLKKENLNLLAKKSRIENRDISS